MNTNIKKLSEITSRIVQAATPADSNGAILSLSHFFVSITKDDNFSSSLSTNNSDIILKNGIAISTVDAALCLDDTIRTITFLKGIHQAVHSLFERFPNERINILYAGCGPYATLLLPLLPLFQEEQLDITLLDINEQSLTSVKSVIKHAGLSNYHIRTVKADATRFTYPSEKKLHLLITETMFYALIREPQLSVTAQLAPQLTQGGILIPESIDLDLCCTLAGNEKRFDISSATNKVRISNAISERLELGKLFSLSKANSFSINKKKNEYYFISKTFEVPENFSSYPDLCITTHIKVFGDYVLNSGESAITNPYCIASLYTFEKAQSFSLVYDFSAIPFWQVKNQREVDAQAPL
ncbi:MAG: hypothetical protein Q8M29_17430 [Bacteroidota bacterium]|nr:hypothetical protein [Bacteroidota bacterium]